LAIETEGPRRMVTLNRAGTDFVVSFYPEDVVALRHTEPNALRKVCTFLRWQIIADNSGSDAATVPAS
jgi:hypothetical protein